MCGGVVGGGMLMELWCSKGVASVLLWSPFDISLEKVERSRHFGYVSEEGRRGVGRGCNGLFIRWMCGVGENNLLIYGVCHSFFDYFCDMATLSLTHNKVLIRSMKRMYKSEGLLLRRWGNEMVVSAWPMRRDRKSTKQVKCRDLFKEAQLLMMADMRRVGSVRYWTRRAKRSGYKTAKGCARAYYYGQLQLREKYRAEGKTFKVQLIAHEVIMGKRVVNAEDMLWRDRICSRSSYDEERLAQEVERILWDSGFV